MFFHFRFSKASIGIICGFRPVLPPPLHNRKGCVNKSQPSSSHGLEISPKTEGESIHVRPPPLRLKIIPHTVMWALSCAF
jgi:hypothetical protein